MSTSNIENDGAWMFPNPTSNFIQLRLSTAENAEFSLWDTRGRRVIQGHVSGSVQWVLPENLADGIYLARLTSENGIKTTRLIIQK